MQAYESGDERGLIYGYVLNGRGGGRRVGRNQIAVLDLLPLPTPEIGRAHV